MKRSPGLAGVLSVVMPGLGHLYAGATSRGFALAAVFFALIQVAVRSPGILIAAIPFVWLFGIVDAIRVAEEVVLANGAGRAPAIGLDRRWALGLVAAGALATLALIPGVWWLARLWPVALVWVGIQLLRGRPVVPDLPPPLGGAWRAAAKPDATTAPEAPGSPAPPAPDPPELPPAESSDADEPPASARPAGEPGKE